MSRHVINPKSDWSPYMMELWEKMIRMQNDEYIPLSDLRYKVKKTWNLLKIINGEK